MSLKKIKLKVITPEKLILEEDVDRVVVPTTQGEITVLPEHVPLVAELRSGDIVGLKGDEKIPMAVVGGFIEVRRDKDKNTNVIILADFAEHVSNLSDEVVEKAKARAEELKKQAENKEVVDFEHFESELERALTRVKIADKWKSRKYRK